MYGVDASPGVDSARDSRAESGMESAGIIF